MSAPDPDRGASPDPGRAHAHAHGHEHEEDVVAEECVDYIERIVYFLDNELDDADCDAVQRHLDECGPCLERYDLQRTVKTVVARSCSEAAPEALRERVLLQLRRVQVRITDS